MNVCLLYTEWARLCRQVDPAVRTPGTGFVLQSHSLLGLDLPKRPEPRIIHFIRRGVEQSGSSSGS